MTIRGSKNGVVRDTENAGAAKGARKLDLIWRQQTSVPGDRESGKPLYQSSFTES